MRGDPAQPGERGTSLSRRPHAPAGPTDLDLTTSCGTILPIRAKPQTIRTRIGG